MEAVRGGQESCVQLLIQNDHSPNCTDSLGRNALVVAAHSGQTELVKYLHSCLRLPLTSVCKKGLSPLHWAALENQTDVVRHLLEVEPSLVHWQDNQGQTALVLSQQAGHKATEKLIASHLLGPDVTTAGAVSKS